MTLFSRNFIVSLSLAISDFVSLSCSIYIASALLLFVTSNKGNDSNLLIVFYVQIMPDDFVMQLHRF